MDNRGIGVHRGATAELYSSRSVVMVLRAQALFWFVR